LSSVKILTLPVTTGRLPASLDHSRNFAAQGPQTKADATHLEFPQVAPWSPTNLAAMISPYVEFRYPLRFRDQ
jgi:hypothetical protein